MCPRTCGCATGWTRTARPPPARKRWRVRASRSRRAGGARTKASSASSRNSSTAPGSRSSSLPTKLETRLDFELDEPGRRPDVFVGGAIPAWAEDRAMDISGFVDPETLRSDFGEYLLERRNGAGVGGGALPGGRPSSGDSARRRPEGPRVLSRRPSSARPGTRSRPRGTSSSRCLIRSRLTGARRGASASSPATAPDGPVPTSSRVW